MKIPALALSAALLSIALLQPSLAEDMPGMKTKASPADQGYMAAMGAMMKAMRVKPTGDADRDFVIMMLPHHQGAVDMAKVELQYGSDPQMRQLATDIVAAQEKEIAQMKDWLAKHGE